MRVMVTGSCGYKGAVLVPKLLAAGHEVTGFDAQWFGVNLAEHPNLRLIKGDIRDGVDCSNQDAVIHLAGIANDPCGELDAKLTWEVNVFATMRLAENAARAGVRRFIFASSASVYGIKDNVPVNEDTEMAPVSDYNKTKMVAERVLLSYANRMAIQIIRPATVCGMSPRLRLDTVVNMLTSQALTTGKIVAHCGPHGAGLMRPNVTIEDITDLYCWLMERPADTVIFNAGFENLSVMAMAEQIRRAVGDSDGEDPKITITETQDKRSYCVDSSRLLAAGFSPQFKVSDAIREITQAHKAGALVIDDRAINLKWMRLNGLVRDAR